MEASPTTRARTATCAVALVLLVVTGVATSGPASAAADPGVQCRVAFEPHEVTARDEPVTLTGELSQPIREVDEVLPEDDSGILVESFDPSEEEPDTIRYVEVTLDTSRADPGDWTLTVVGTTTDCAGVVTVREPGRGR